MVILMSASYRHTPVLRYYAIFRLVLFRSIFKYQFNWLFFWFFDPWSFRQVYARCVSSKSSECVVSVQFSEGNVKVSVVLAMGRLEMRRIFVETSFVKDSLGKQELERKASKD